MPKTLPFRNIAQTLLDRWIQTDPKSPSAADAVYSGVLQYMSKTMRLSVYRTDDGDPMDWCIEAIRHTTIKVSASVDFDAFFRTQKIRDFEDQAYIKSVVFPTVYEVYKDGRHRMEYIRTEILGNEIGYDRLLLPQKTVGSPEWIISFVDAGYLLNRPASPTTPEVEDRVLVQLLAEGNSAKEIAKYLDLSHRTIEHRIERMKERYGARNVPHLVAMLISRQATKKTDPS